MVKQSRRLTAGLATLLVCFLASADAITCPAAESAWPNRREFAATMGRVREGMSASEVLEILGPPDERRPSTHDQWEFWCYGVSSAGQFPTLGAVAMASGKTVRAVFGAQPCALGEDDFTEDETRSMLAKIDAMGTIVSPPYDPLAMIRAVNQLQAVGKDRALRLLREYRRVAPWPGESNEKLLLLLPILFDVKRVEGPHIIFGATSPPRPEDEEVRRLLPHFPIVLVDDIPLLLITGYRIAGWPTQVEPLLDGYAEYGVLRDRPLTPTANLADAVAQMERSKWWVTYQSDPESGRCHLHRQIMKLTRTLQPGNPLNARRADCESIGAWWRQSRARLTSSHIYWNELAGCYARKVTK